MTSHPYQDRQYIPPNAGTLPPAFDAQIERLNTLRQRWADATAKANAARQAVREAPEKYRAAVVEAAKNGQDIHKVADIRIEAARDLEVRELAENGLHREVVQAWADLWCAVAGDHDEVVAHVDKPAEAATRKVADLEQQLAQARADLAVALGNRRWVLARHTPVDWDYARTHAARPQPLDGADADTLARLRRDEAKAAAQREQQAKAQQIAKQRAADAEQQYAERREAQARRREAARLR